MSQGRNNLRQLASRLVAVQEQARSLGIFADDRELPECRKCGLLEDVTLRDNSYPAARNPWVMIRDSAFRNFRRTISAVLRAARRFIFRLRDESLEDSDNLPDPDVLAQEIVDDLESALEQFREIANDLGSEILSKTH
jgi:hypothetical protein